MHATELGYASEHLRMPSLSLALALALCFALSFSRAVLVRT